MTEQDFQELETVNDTEDQAFEDTMSDSRFDPQPWGREEV